jgi:hypothetical protein
MKIRMVLVTVLAAALACTLTPPATTAPGDSELQTRVSGTLTALAPTPGPLVTPTEAAPTDTPTPEVPPVLPAPLYFLANRSGSFQVWRVEVDGATLDQITDEAADVDAFDVSPADGTLAYVSGNQLILANADGGDRHVLVAGAELSATPDESRWSQALGNPVWSPSGDRLAYSLNGLNIYTIATGATANILANTLPTQDAPASIMLYNPDQFSPDGSQLLARVAYYEAGSLIIIPSEGGLLRSTSIPQGIVCCQPAWSNDGTSIFLANDSVGIVSPGLWRIDADSGQGVTLVGGSQTDSPLIFVGWPKQAPDGRLLYFYGETATFPERGTWPTTMTVSQADGVTGRTPLRSDSYIPAEVLWWHDGSLAVISDASEISNVYPPLGPLRLLWADGSPAVTMTDQGRNLRWGP